MMTKHKADVAHDEAPETDPAVPQRAPADVLAELQLEIADLPGMSPSGVATAAERMQRLVAELQGNAGAQMSDWRPIATAPKGGETIWLGSPRQIRIGFWEEGRWVDWQMAHGDGRRDLLFEPTHWQPLPAPPEAA